MIDDKINAKGEVTFTLTDAEGNVKQTFVRNLVVGAGLAYIASRMKDATSAVASHMAVGTNAIAANIANTTLGAEVARSALFSTTIVTTTVANDAVQYVANFNAGVATGALTEAGIFNAGAAGTMIARTVYPVINKGALDTLAITWKITAA